MTGKRTRRDLPEPSERAIGRKTETFPLKHSGTKKSKGGRGI
jgi:hypothetical protein